MTKRQIAILVGLGLSVLCVFFILGYLVVDKVSITSDGVSISLAHAPGPPTTPTPTVAKRPWVATPKTKPKPTATPTPDYFVRSQAVLLTFVTLFGEGTRASESGDLSLICFRVEDWQSTVRDCRDAWDRLVPPLEIKAAHELMGEAMDDYTKAYDNMAWGCKTGNAAYFEQSLADTERGGLKVRRANQMVEDYLNSR